MSADYEVRVWRMPDRWVDIDLSGALQYAESDKGHGMQTLADPDSEEYARVMELCRRAREAFLELDDYLRGLEETCN